MREAFQQRFGIGRAAPGNAADFPLQRLPQSAEIIDFAVERDDVAAILRQHRLMPRRRKINDGQAAMRQRDAARFVKPDSGVIRPAMAERRAHLLREASQFVAPGASAGVKNSRNSAHVLPLFTAKAQRSQRVFAIFLCGFCAVVVNFVN